MVGAAVLAAAAAALAPPEAQAAPAVCYDVAVVATMSEIADSRALPSDYIGFQADFLLEVEQTLWGQPPGPRFWARGVLADAFTSTTRLTIFVQKGGDAHGGPPVRDTPVGLLVPARSDNDYRIVEIATDPRRRTSSFPRCTPG
jgi:hypothetical protein